MGNYNTAASEQRPCAAVCSQCTVRRLEQTREVPPCLHPRALPAGDSIFLQYCAVECFLMWEKGGTTRGE